MRRRLFGALVLAVCAALVMAACGGGGDEGGGGGGGSSSGSLTIDGQKANNHGTEDASGKDELEVEADDFYFEPTVITGTAGEKIKIELDNEGDATHNFSVDSLGIDEVVASGDKADIDVTLPSSGTLVFYCKFHKSSGMIGEFKVS